MSANAFRGKMCYGLWMTVQGGRMGTELYSDCWTPHHTGRSGDHQGERDQHQTAGGVNLHLVRQKCYTATQWLRFFVNTVILCFLLRLTSWMWTRSLRTWQQWYMTKEIWSVRVTKNLDSVSQSLVLMSHVNTDAPVFTDSIEANVENADVYVDRGAIQLQKAAYYRVTIIINLLI